MTFVVVVVVAVAARLVPWLVATRPRQSGIAGAALAAGIL